MAGAALGAGAAAVGELSSRFFSLARFASAAFLSSSSAALDAPLTKATACASSAQQQERMHVIKTHTAFDVLRKRWLYSCGDRDIDAHSAAS